MTEQATKQTPINFIDMCEYDRSRSSSQKLQEHPCGHRIQAREREVGRGLQVSPCAQGMKDWLIIYAGVDATRPGVASLCDSQAVSSK